jgi:hypothetical protein
MKIYQMKNMEINEFIMKKLIVTITIFIFPLNVFATLQKVKINLANIFPVFGENRNLAKK